MGRRRHPARPLRAPGIALALVLLTAACGDDDDTAVTADRDVVSTDPGAGGADAPPGEIRVRLEPVEGVFIEGFEIGLRFETGSGQVIASTLWTDFVASTGRTDLEAYYDSVLSQPVPAGSVRIDAEVNIGIGPGPSIPDLEGELPCTLELDVAPDEVVDVEVGFDGTDDCLRTVGAGAGSSGDPQEAPSTTVAPETTTSEPSFAVGTDHYVDVDLECQAFELAGGTWVLVEGDTSSWQPAGERHEGGTFTIEAPGRGTFSGDAAGEKTAVFERLGDGVEPTCRPVPRP